MKGKAGSIVKLAAVLCGFALIATLILTVCNYVTADRISFLAAQAKDEAKRIVLPAADRFADVNGEFSAPVKMVYEGKKGVDPVGYCVSVAPSGYGGAIELMVGVDDAGKVTGVSVISMSETPGLGAKAKDVSFYGQYTGKSEHISVIKSGIAKENEINAISGATITSKAVTAGVNAALETVAGLKGGN